MKHFLRPYRSFNFSPGYASLALAICFLPFPHTAHSQAQSLTPLFANSHSAIAHASQAGYLGVDVTDIDASKAQALKLKEARGALITLIDHDAPAGQIGLKVNDVVLAIDGQSVSGAEQLHGILRQIPPGRKISLEISRDGSVQTMEVQLADRRAMEKSIWSKIGADVESIVPSRLGGSSGSTPAMGMVSGDNTAVPSSRFHVPFFTSTLNVGVLVEPLTSQMAEYLGVKGGLMVKQVAQKSQAAAAGLRAFDVILKVGAGSIATSADWTRALRANRDKPVQVTILRDKKQQTLTLQIDSKRRGDA